MCELMAAAFAQPVSADFSIREFGLRDADNADGWGLAWYPDRSLAIVKEPIRWGSSPYPSFLENYPDLRSRVYIAHVRHGTVGGSPTRADTHPFARELDGTEYCFAHNGTIDNHRELPLGRYRPIGGTDSEHVFCRLLDAIARRPERLENEAGWRWLHGQLAAVNERGKLNCLLTDGQHLFCYHDRAAYKGLTFRRVVLRGDGPRRFEDATVQLDLGGPDINHGFVVATCALSASGWQPFIGGELVVLKDGRMCHSSHRDLSP